MKIKKVLLSVAAVLLAALLISMGIYRLVGIYHQYRSDMLAQQSRQMEGIIRASARELDLIFDSYEQQVSRYPERRDFVRAEEAFLETGSADEWTALLSRPDITRPWFQSLVAVYDAGGAFLASNSQSYPRDTGADDDVGGGLRVRVDPQGERWFVFEAESETGPRYEAAVSLSKLFEYLGKNTRVGKSGYLILLDSAGSFASYYGNGTGETGSVAELLERDSALGKSMLRQLTDSLDDAGEEEYFVIRGTRANSGAAGDETLVVSTPVESSDGGLTLFAALRFEEFDSLLTDTLEDITGVILLEIVGALVLFLLAALVIVFNRRSQMELEAVRERADLMEEINRQQLSLAHTERLQQLGLMTGGIVHECNNLLTPIMGQSMLLLEELDEDSPQFEKTLDIYEASEHARDVLRRMSVMGKKNVDMSFRTISVTDLLRKTMNLAAMAKSPHIQMELEASDRPLYVSGNEQLLTQAVLNLCINACQAMGDEGVLKLTAAAESHAGRQYAVIRVLDTGPGLSEESMESMFVPFYTTKGNQGTGVGLAICRKILEMHKGTVQAANREEGGAVMTVRIPTCEPPEED